MILNGQNLVEINKRVETEVYSPLNSTMSSLPNVTNIYGPDMPWVGLMECYTAYTDKPLPADCFFVWLVTPSNNVEVRDSNTSNICISFKEKGNYMIHCRVQSTTGEVTRNFYKLLQVNN